jgi:hypothetical protein
MPTGKDADNSGSATDLSVESLHGVRGADFPFVEGCVMVELQTILQTLQKALDGIRESILIFLSQHVSVLSCTLQIRLKPDLLEFLCKEFLLRTKDMGQDVSHKVHFAPLPLAPQEASFHSRLDPFMGI